MTPAEFKRKWARYSGKETSAPYGFDVDLTDEQILERLLALNLARAAEEAKLAKKSASKKAPCRAKTEEEFV